MPSSAVVEDLFEVGVRVVYKGEEGLVALDNDDGTYDIILDGLTSSDDGKEVDGVRAADLSAAGKPAKREPSQPYRKNLYSAKPGNVSRAPKDWQNAKGGGNGGGKSGDDEKPAKPPAPATPAVFTGMATGSAMVAAVGCWLLPDLKMVVCGTAVFLLIMSVRTVMVGQRDAAEAKEKAKEKEN
jgi:hypothetical protein